MLPQFPVAAAAGSEVDVPVLVRRERTHLRWASGSNASAASVAASLERDPSTWSPVDPDRADRLLDAVRTLRQGRRITDETHPSPKPAVVPRMTHDLEMI
jgi:hypothetical protein